MIEFRHQSCCQYSCEEYSLLWTKKALYMSCDCLQGLADNEGKNEIDGATN